MTLTISPFIIEEGLVSTSVKYTDDETRYIFCERISDHDSETEAKHQVALDLNEFIDKERKNPNYRKELSERFNG